MRNKRVTKFTLFAIFCFGLFYACANPFSTRTPETPNLGNDISDNSLQTDPNRMLEKIQQSFELKDARSYRACFAEAALVGQNYLYIAENSEAARLINWGVDDEENYFLNLTSEGDVVLQFSPENPLPTPVSTSPDTLQLDFEYEISAVFQVRTEHYRGRSVLKIFKAADERWYIFEWRDLLKQGGTAADSSWSTLRANYRIAPSG